MDRLPVTRIETPTPWSGIGPVNSYLIEASPLTLVDTGFNSPQGQNAVRLTLAGRDVFLEAIERILITHGHPDHYGLTAMIQGLSGAKVYFPAHEIKRVIDPEMLIRTGRLLVEAGMPLEMLFKMNKQRGAQPSPRVDRDEVVPVHDGDRFPFGDFELVAYDMPGHTGGHVVYLEPQTRTLFAGDQLLPKTSPNPLLEPSIDDPEERRRSLRDYMGSLHKMAAMDLTLVYPGHGDPVTDPGELIRSTIEHHEKRKVEVAGYLTASGQTPFAIAERMFPDKMEYEAFLAVSEVIAHLDLVVDDGDAVTEDRDGVVYYSASR
jgi:glyoxylase-like metal-dependent hydrolase (beta-lactamase superfamily II)